MKKEITHMKYKMLDQKGQGLTEYITLLLLVSICSVAVAKTLGVHRLTTPH